jgi:hypothetical protein
MAIEIVDLHPLKMVMFHSFLYVYQMVRMSPRRYPGWFMANPVHRDRLGIFCGLISATSLSFSGLCGNSM